MAGAVLTLDVSLQPEQRFFSTKSALSVFLREFKPEKLLHEKQVARMKREETASLTWAARKEASRKRHQERSELRADCKRALRLLPEERRLHAKQWLRMMCEEQALRSGSFKLKHLLWRAELKLMSLQNGE